MLDDNSIIYLASFFLAYSFIGWIIDTIAYSIGNKRLGIGAFLHLPFCTIYGVPAVLMIIFNDYLKGNYALFYLFAVLILTMWEYAIGRSLEIIFKKKIWDYSNKKLNYRGIICFDVSLFWGFLALFFIGVIHPFVSKYIFMIHIDTLKIILIILYSALLIDEIVSIYLQWKKRGKKKK